MRKKLLQIMQIMQRLIGAKSWHTSAVAVTGFWRLEKIRIQID